MTKQTDKIFEDLKKDKAIKVDRSNDILNDVYTQAREALDLYKYAATAYGIGIVKIEYGIEDHVAFRNMKNPKKLHRAKINYGDNPYFNYCGRRLHLGDFIRTNL